ncbi:protein kinase, partial [Gloeophyllum trabeum ATCC 11539]
LGSTRSYTPLKVVGDGSFGTVWLCDWHGPLPPNTPLSAMQCGAGARPEWTGKRLVAVKRMKKKWEGGWEECRKLKELESLRAIPYHPNIIPLYDAFLLPTSKELYFVFESMEGNLYQLIKSRKGRPLAGGLVSSIFKQVVSGLHHIHASGYFHRDMKPENLLVTTTGLYDYTPVSPVAPPNAPMEKDVVVIVKLADFGLARETKSKPPYTEYVSTRWYRAPEVLLRSRDYSNPVDMWALGTIMAELVNLRPLFPGQGEIDQVGRICEVLGDPAGDYGHDARGKSIGGGRWARGIKMAKCVGFAFPKVSVWFRYACDVSGYAVRLPVTLGLPCTYVFPNRSILKISMPSLTDLSLSSLSTVSRIY